MKNEVPVSGAVRIEPDRRLLAAAAAIMGTATSTATVNEALRRIVVHERQLRHLERLAAGVLSNAFAPDPLAVER